MGLLQSNMTWLTKKRELSYHWILDLFSRLKLPIFDGMAEGLKKANEVREKSLAKKQTDLAKEKRTNWKKARAQEHQERKQWMRRQAVYHTYGSDDDDDDNEDEDEGTDEGGISVVTSKRRRSQHATQNKCKCGSTEHYRTSHRLCPLNKKKQVAPIVQTVTSIHQASSNSDTEEELANLFCTCGSSTVTHNRSCPLNPRNCIAHGTPK